MKGGNCGDSGTSTTLISTGTHMQWNNGTGTKNSGTNTPRLLEYQCTFGTGTTLTSIGTNMRSLQDLSGIHLGARACSSFDPHFEITNEDCI